MGQLSELQNEDAVQLATGLHAVLRLLASNAAFNEVNAVLDEGLLDDLEESLPEGEQSLRSLVIDVFGVITDMRRREKELAALYETARELTSVRETDEVLRAIVVRAQELVPSADVTYLSVADEEGQFRVRASVGLTAPDLRSMEAPPGRGMVAKIKETKEMMWTRHYGSDPAIVHDETVDRALADDGLKAVLGVPLLIREEVIGVLFASNRHERPLDATEKALLTAFADHAALAIDNARLFAKLDAARRSLEERMRSIQRAARLHEELTGLVLKDHDVSDVAETLARVFRTTVHIVDPDTAALETRSAADEPGTDAAPVPDLSGQIVESQRSGRCVAVPVEDRVLYVAALSTESRGMGAVVLESSAELPDSDVRSLERAAHIVSLLFYRRQAVVEAEERAGGELFAELLREGEPSAYTQLLAKTRGLDLEREYICLAVSREGGRRLDLFWALGNAARETGGLAGENDGIAGALIPSECAEQAASELHQRLHNELGGEISVVAASPVLLSSAELSREMRMAASTIRLTRLLGRTNGPTTTAELGLYSVLFDAERADVFEAFMRETIGPLLDNDRESGGELVETVRAFFDQGMNAAQTARLLYLHPNTVLKRLAKVKAILGEGWDQGDRGLRLRVALQLQELTDPA